MTTWCEFLDGKGITDNVRWLALSEGEQLALSREWDGRVIPVRLDVNSLDPLEAWRSGAGDCEFDVEQERAQGGDVRYYGKDIEL